MGLKSASVSSFCYPGQLIFKIDRETRHTADITRIIGGKDVSRRCADVAQEPLHHLVSISHEYYRSLPIAIPLLSYNKLAIKTN